MLAGHCPQVIVAVQGFLRMLVPTLEVLLKIQRCDYASVRLHYGAGHIQHVAELQRYYFGGYGANCR